MTSGKFVSYLRVSTARQGQSGLGLEAQRDAVTQYLIARQSQLVAQVIEIETGKRNDRPKLAEALRLCRLHGATLVIAKLDRLARNVAFISNLMEAGVEFTAVDFPQANTLTIHVLAAVAEHEAAAISKRTKEALAQKRKFYETITSDQRADLLAKRCRIRLGSDGLNLPSVCKDGARASAVTRSAAAVRRARDLAPLLQELRSKSLRSIAAELTARSIPTPRGGTEWNATQVKRVLCRVPELFKDYANP